MNKKLFCLSLAAIFSCVTFGVRADDAENIFPKEGTDPEPALDYIDSYVAYPAPPSLPYNMYWGFQLGVANLKYGRASTDLTVTDQNDQRSSGGLIFGWGKTYNRFYFGFEAQALVNYSKNYNVFGYDNSSQAKNVSYTFNFDFRPGYLVAKNLLSYLIVGVSGDASNNFKKGVIGVRGGLGVELYVAKTFSIRGEYVYTNYFKARSLASSVSNQFNLGLLWHF